MTSVFQAVIYNWVAFVGDTTSYSLCQQNQDHLPSCFKLLSDQINFEVVMRDRNIV